MEIVSFHLADELNIGVEVTEEFAVIKSQKDARES